MDLEQYKIIHLSKEQWKNVPIPMRYTTEQYYDVKENIYYCDENGLMEL